jgi:flavorubredoxin
VQRPRRAQGAAMTTRIDEIASGIHRISTYSPDGPPGGITFNQFVIDADEPMLIHTGMRFMFAGVARAVDGVVGLERLRYITSCHASRPDEYGAVNQFLAAAPHAEVVHGQAGCFLCLTDMADRPPRPLADGEVLDLGGKRVRWIDTPHVPGPWEAGVLFEERTATLFVGDLFSRTQQCDPITCDDIVDASVAHDQMMHGHAITAHTGPTLRRLAELRPARLALMHGPTYEGDAADALNRFADYFEAELSAALV